MPPPANQPFIKTTYGRDGSVTREPTGFGGTLCNAATAPYDALQRPTSSQPTAEANEPAYLQQTVKEAERELEGF